MPAIVKMDINFQIYAVVITVYDQVIPSLSKNQNFSHFLPKCGQKIKKVNTTFFLHYFFLQLGQITCLQHFLDSSYIFGGWSVGLLICWSTDLYYKQHRFTSLKYYDVQTIISEMFFRCNNHFLIQIGFLERRQRILALGQRTTEEAKYSDWYELQEGW